MLVGPTVPCFVIRVSHPFSSRLSSDRSKISFTIQIWIFSVFSPVPLQLIPVALLGTVFQWFKSYISNRQQRVHIDGSLSCPQDLHFGVPQGSVLAPFLFCLYTTSISQMNNTHDVSHHMYADDTQVYIELSQSDTHQSISSLSNYEIK